MHFLSLALLSIVFAASSFAGTLGCPDQNYAFLPIVGATGGTASSCGNAGVTPTEAFASTPGGGSVEAGVLSSYVGFDLFSLAGNGVFVTEGSAVLFSQFSVAPGSAITFDWESNFEEGATGSLFYILNGSLVTLDQILPTGQGLPGSSNSGTVVTALAPGLNTLAFGAISLAAFNPGAPHLNLDPQISLSNIAVNASAVPEPATLGLAGLALAALAHAKRRRQ